MSRIDLHVHALMADALFFFRGRPGDGRLAGRAGSTFRNQVSFQGWREGGFGVAVATLYSPPVLHRGAGHLREILRQATVAQEFARAHPKQVALARSPAEARRIAGEGRTALVLAVEGAHGIAAANDDVGALAAAGIRLLTLAHLRDNAVAAAAVTSSPLEGPNFALVKSERRGRLRRNRRGLTALGGEVVRAMQRRGMLIDLAHASDRTFDDVVALTRSDGTPLFVSHTSSRALHASERCLADDQAELIGERRGAIGVSLWRRLLGFGADRAAVPPGARPGTTEAFIAHYRRLRAAAGPRVGLGSDLNGMVPRVRGSHACPCGVRHLGDWPAVEAALAAAGVQATELSQSAEPFLTAWEGARALGEPSCS
jgi:membrane dipeptidase